MFGPWPKYGKFQPGVFWSASKKRPYGISIKAEALQNFTVSRSGVCGFVLVFLGRILLLLFSGTLAQESITSRVLGFRVWCKQFMQPVLALCCSLKLFYPEGRGEKMAPGRSFVPGEGSSSYPLSGKPSQKN